MLNLKNVDEWEQYCKSGKKPDDIPNHPAGVYKNKGWKTLGDWLGTDYIANRYRIFWSYEKAKAFVIKQGMMGFNEFRKAKSEKKLPDDIPSNPNLEYEKEWEGWGIFLGTGIIANTRKSENYLPMREALPIFRSLAKKYYLIGKADWIRFAKTHKNELEKLKLPANPWQSYTREKVLRKMNK